MARKIVSDLDPAVGTIGPLQWDFCEPESAEAANGIHCAKILGSEVPLKEIC